MSKTIPIALYNHLFETTTTLCTCWKVTRRDGLVMGFTDHDRDLINVNGVNYAAATGYTRSALQSASDLSIDNLEISGLIDSTAITADDIRAGVYDGAKVSMFLINWATVDGLGTPVDTCIISSGTIGDITTKGSLFIAEQRGLLQALDTNFIRLYVPDCDADLGDARCGVDLSTVTETGAITSVVDVRRNFAATISGGRAPDFFNAGKITFTSGLNAGRTMEVKAVGDAGGGTYAVLTYLPIGSDIAVADTFAISAGCNKDCAPTGDCKVKFNNLVNGRGFPDVPGLDLTLQSPNAV